MAAIVLASFLRCRSFHPIRRRSPRRRRTETCRSRIRPRSGNSSDHADATDRFLLCLTPRYPSFASPCRGTCPFLCTTPDTLPRRTRPRNRGTRRISAQSITRKVLWQISHTPNTTRVSLALQSFDDDLLSKRF